MVAQEGLLGADHQKTYDVVADAGSGCRCRGAALKGPLGNKDALSLAGRHLCEVQKGRACGSCGRK